MLPQAVRQRTDSLRSAAIWLALEHADTGGERKVKAIGIRLVVSFVTGPSISAIKEHVAHGSSVSH